MKVYQKVYTWKDPDVSASSTFTSAGGSMTWEDLEDPVILEDGPWSPLYEYEDYVGLMHALLADELGLDDEVY